MDHLSGISGVNQKSSRGFSLVEMMVAIVIGLILLAGVSSVMVSTKRTYNTQDSLGRLQENARIAMVILERALRNVGYIGCNISASNITNVLDPSGAGYSDFNYSLGYLLEGSDNGANFQPSGTTVSSALGTVVPRPNTDLFVVRGADTDSSFKITSKSVNESAALHVNPTTEIKAGDILILSDCSSTDIFQATSDASSGTLTHNSGASQEPGNDPNLSATGSNNIKLSKSYSSDAKLMKFKSTIFYIGTGKSGEPALFRHRLGVDTSTGKAKFFEDELVEGIENLQVSYGIDTSTPHDQIPDEWKQASGVGSNWDHVVAVRFGIIARALANLSADRRTANRVEDTKQLDIDGDGNPDFLGTETTTTTSDTGVTTKDRLYDRRMFRTTVLLRNFVNREAG